MYQRWDDLLFLHWRCDEEIVTQHIPEQLSVDSYNGTTYVSIIAFRMNKVRPAWLPALPWLSYFFELNVRVYVRDKYGEPGIYFLSLDCNRAPAVWIARRMFSLPYQHAAMQFDTCGDSTHFPSDLKTLTCKRLHQSETATYRWSAPSNASPAQPGTVEFFLTERYNFFTIQRGVLMRGQVHHAPYQICTPDLRAWSELPVAWDSFPVSNRAPDLASYSPGVSIEAFALTSAG
jgi:uncharacterized protein YqjF (DUF2071 family)